MLVGIIFTASYIIYFKFMGGTPDEYWWGISPEGIGTLGMAINFVVAFVVSRFTAETPHLFRIDHSNSTFLQLTIFRIDNIAKFRLYALIY